MWSLRHLMALLHPFPLVTLGSLGVLPLLFCFSPYHYRRSLAWLFICLVSIAEMPWASASWYSFPILCCKDQTFYELNHDHAKAQGYSPTWNLDQDTLQGKATFTLLMSFSIWKLIEQRSHTLSSMGQEQQRWRRNTPRAMLCFAFSVLFSFNLISCDHEENFQGFWVQYTTHESPRKFSACGRLVPRIRWLLLTGLWKACFQLGLLCY